MHVHIDACLLSEQEEVEEQQERAEVTGEWRMSEINHREGGERNEWMSRVGEERRSGETEERGER